MKIDGVRAMLIVSLVIILLYILGLFLPIIKNTKSSKIYNNNLITFDIFLSTQNRAFHIHAFLHQDLKYLYLFFQLLLDTI